MKVSLSARLVKAVALVLALSRPAFSVEAANEIPLVERPVLGGRVTLLVPAAFSLMSDEARRLKYPNENRPAVVYSDERGTVNLAVSHTAQALSPDQVAAAHKSLEAGFKALYPSATWYGSQMFEKEGRRLFALDLSTPAIDTEVRNMLVGTSCEGRLLLVSFNVTRELVPTWIEVGQKMLSSLMVNCGG